VEAAQQLIATVLPDLILLKWILRGQSATAFSRELREGVRTREIPLVLLGPSEDEMRLIDEMIRRADGCVPKSAQGEEITGRIEAMLRTRQIPRPASNPATGGNLVVDPAKERVFLRRGDTLIELRIGLAERRLLYLLISNPDRVFSRTRLLQELWGDREVKNERIVDSYVKRLRVSLRAVECGHMIESVRGFGYKFTTEGVPEPARGAVA
jgi:two-component system phosphate regulon response regulator PhoB